MIGEQLDKAADHAFSRYGILLNSFTGLFAKAIGGEDRITDRSLVSLQKEAYEEANAWLDVERQFIIDSMDTFGERGARIIEMKSGAPVEDLSRSILDHMEYLAESLDVQMRLQVERDVALLVDALRAVSLRERLQRGRGAAAINGRGWDVRNAALTRLSFEFVDRSNRRWPSARHVRTLWRMYLVTAHSEAAIIRANEIGLDALQVSHPDQSHKSYGVELPVADDGFDEIWADLRKDVFHPNSHAWLSPVIEEA